MIENQWKRAEERRQQLRLNPEEVAQLCVECGQGLPKMTGYIYLVTGGPSELLATGKAIADGTIPTR